MMAVQIKVLGATLPEFSNQIPSIRDLRLKFLIEVRVDTAGDRKTVRAGAIAIH